MKCALVLEAVSAGDALLVVEKHGGTISLVVADIMLPLLDGRELIERIRCTVPHLKVLYISGQVGINADDDSMGRGEAYLQKPFLPHELGRAVRSLLDITVD